MANVGAKVPEGVKILHSRPVAGGVVADVISATHDPIDLPDILFRERHGGVRRIVTILNDGHMTEGVPVPEWDLNEVPLALGLR